VATQNCPDGGGAEQGGMLCKSEGHSRPSSSAKMAWERLHGVDLQDIYKDGKLENDEPEIKILLNSEIKNKAAFKSSAC
jgi:hypothetical protein